MTQQPKKLSPLALPQNKKKRKALGSGIDWSDKALDDMSEVTDADLQAAMALWADEAPKPLKTLLKADVESKDQPLQG